MAVSDLSFRITADTSSFSSGLNQATARLRGVAGEAQTSISGVSTQLRTSLSGVSSGISSVLTRLGPLVAGFASIASVRAFAQISDQASLATARIQGLTGSIDATREAQASLFEISQRLQAGYGEAVASFARMLPAVQELGGGVQHATRLTEVLLTTAKLSGASAAEASASATQFAQALASGVLQGDELKSILENNSTLARTLAEGLGVSIGELRKMGEEGELTADLVSNTLLASYDEIQAKAAELPGTVGGAWTQIKNAFTQFVVSTEQSTGVFAGLSATMSEIAKVIGIVAQSFGGAKSQSSALGQEQGARNFAQAAGRAFAYLADVVGAVVRGIVEQLRALVAVFQATGNQLGALAAAVVAVARGDFAGALAIMRDSMSQSAAAVMQLGSTVVEHFGRMKTAILGGGDALAAYREQLNQTADTVQQRKGDLAALAAPGGGAGETEGGAAATGGGEEEVLQKIEVYRRRIREVSTRGGGKGGTDEKGTGEPQGILAQALGAGLEGVQQTFGTALDNILTRAKTFGQAMAGVWGAMRAAIVGEIGKMLMARVAAFAREKLMGLADISTKAATAGAGAASALASIPIVGPALAAAAAPAMVALVTALGGGIRSAAGGFDIPAGINPVTQLHAQEMVLPAEQAEVIRELARGGGAREVNVTVQGTSAGEFYILTRTELVKAIKSAHREFAFT